MISLARLEVVRGFVRKVCSVIRALLPRFDNLSRGVRKRFSFSWGPAELDRMVTASRAEMVNTLRQSDLCSEHLASLMDVLRAAHVLDHGLNSARRGATESHAAFTAAPNVASRLHSAILTKKGNTYTT
jgi:hypothetical protein